MLSNPLNDEDRFRGYIEETIKTGNVEAFDNYTEEPESKKKARHANARKEAKKAEKHAQELGLNGDGKKAGKKIGAKDDLGGLAAVIQQRQKGRAATFLDDLEAKYAAPQPRKGKAKGKRKVEEPPEEAFEKAAAPSTKRKRSEPEPEADKAPWSDKEGDDDEESDVDDFVSGDEEEDEEEDVKPSKRRKQTTRQVGGKKRTHAKRR